MEKLNKIKGDFSVKESFLLIAAVSLLLCPFLYAEDGRDQFLPGEANDPRPVKSLPVDIPTSGEKPPEISPYKPPVASHAGEKLDGFYKGTLDKPGEPPGDPEEEKEDEERKGGGQQNDSAPNLKRVEDIYRQLERLKKKQETKETGLKLQKKEEEEGGETREIETVTNESLNLENILLPELEGEKQDQEDTEDIDTDGDGIPDGEDDDIDGDGISNEEDLDYPLDAVKVQPRPQDLQDTDGDGLADGSDPDIDGDGIPNEGDPDADGNGIPDQTGLNDIDGDGVPDWLDDDKDGDGVANTQDEDADGDGKKDKS